MSIYRGTVILCDECGEDFPAGDATYREAREEAAKEGWQHDKRGDTCPNHNGYVRSMLGWVKIPEGSVGHMHAVSPSSLAAARAVQAYREGKP